VLTELGGNVITPQWSPRSFGYAHFLVRFWMPAHISLVNAMSNDTELLRRYIEERSEEPFAELVREHLGLVYSAALREVNGDRTLAEDVSQAVFTELARKAPRLLHHPSLAGWLYITVRHLAANYRRSEQHRKLREQEAQTMNGLVADDTPTTAWAQIRPVLDDALHELSAADREAVVLRFLEDRSLGEVGARLGLNENAARMRVDRALEKLRGRLTRRGITSTASCVAAAMAVGVLTPAPEALAGSVVSTAMASGTAAGTLLTLMKFMSMTSVKIGLVGAFVVVGVAAPIYQQTRLERVQAENEQLRAREPDLAAQEAELTSLRTELGRLQQAGTNQGELERLRLWQAQVQPELLRLRGMAGVARQANAEVEQLRGQLARQTTEVATHPPSEAMADALKGTMERQVDGELSRLTATLRLTPTQIDAAREILLRKAQVMSAGMMQAFSGKYDKQELLRLGAQAGDTDTQIKALLSSEQLAAYPDYKQREAVNTARQAAGTELMTLDSTLSLTADQEDRVFAALYALNFDQMTGRSKPNSATSVTDTLQWSLDQKVKALEPVLTPTQLENYRKQLAIQSKLSKEISGKLEGASDSK
jgi:RNA polymerase sigma factor (sigma-70 family)